MDIPLKVKYRLLVAALVASFVFMFYLYDFKIEFKELDNLILWSFAAAAPMFVMLTLAVKFLSLSPIRHEVVREIPFTRGDYQTVIQFFEEEEE